MDRKDEPPAYSAPAYSAPPAEAPQPPQPQNMYQYQAQTNYGFTGQPITNFAVAPQQGVVVSTVGMSSVYNAPPQDYTTQAWLACLCCFWPTGLLAIMKANESRDAVARGDMVGAHAAAGSARQMVRISYVVGIISVVFAVVIVVVWIAVFASSINDNPYD